MAEFLPIHLKTEEWLNFSLGTQNHGEDASVLKTMV